MLFEMYDHQMGFPWQREGPMLTLSNSSKTNQLYKTSNEVFYVRKHANVWVVFVSLIHPFESNN